MSFTCKIRRDDFIEVKGTWIRENKINKAQEKWKGWSIATKKFKQNKKWYVIQDYGEHKQQL